MCLMPPKKALMAHQPPAQSQVEINHANFYTPCAYSNNFSKGVDLDLLTVQGYMKDTPRHYRHVHCTACWAHPVKPLATIARCKYMRVEKYRNRTHAFCNPTTQALTTTPVVWLYNMIVLIWYNSIFHKVIQIFLIWLDLVICHFLFLRICTLT